MFGGGGGGLNPQKMQQMMEQMGIDADELDAEEVIINTGEEALVFDAPDVTRIDAQGQYTYQIVGDPETREQAGELESGSSDSDSTDSSGDIPTADIEIVSSRTGASEDEAHEALIAADGDLASAVERLE